MDIIFALIWGFSLASRLARGLGKAFRFIWPHARGEQAQKGIHSAYMVWTTVLSGLVRTCQNIIAADWHPSFTPPNPSHSSLEATGPPTHCPTVHKWRARLDSAHALSILLRCLGLDLRLHPRLRLRLRPRHMVRRKCIHRPVLREVFWNF